MTEPLASLNGRTLPLSEAAISLFDLGFVQGATVTEMIRTFHHRPFRLEDHLRRLQFSLDAVGFPNPPNLEEVPETIDALLAHNASLIPPSHDLGVNVFVTAGLQSSYLAPTERDQAGRPTVGVHTWPLPFELWADRYDTGQHLLVPPTRQIPARCLDPRIKMRSRLHWNLADRQAQQVDADARAILLDDDGCLTETATANFFIILNDEIRTPSPEKTLGGISRDVVAQLAPQVGCRAVHADITPDDVASADEAFTSSSPYCLLPVTRFNGRAVGSGRPGPICANLMGAWNRLAGLDIIDQARTAARHRMSPPTR